MLIVHDERRCNFSPDRSPDLIDGIKIRGVWWQVYNLDVVAGGVVFDKHHVVRSEVVQHDDQPISGVCSLKLLQQLPDVFLCGVLSEGDDGDTLDRKNLQAIGPDLRSIFR